MWFSALAFGGSNYEYTPIGAVSHVSEPGGVEFVNETKVYFGLWQIGKTFSLAAWASKRSQFTQANGDPFVTK
jgi:hypothetical protein